MAAAKTKSIGNDSRPSIALLSLKKECFWDELYSGLVDMIEAKANVIELTNVPETGRYLMSNKPSAIIVTDGAITKKKPVLSKRLKEYVQNGGTLILATYFPNGVRPFELENWFRETWNLPWKTGDYCRTTVSPNPRRIASRLTDACLPKPFSLKSLFLKNVAANARVFIPTADSRVESHVFAPTSVDSDQSSVVFASIDKGWLGYVGDVNDETESFKVILAMCGL